MKKKFILFIVIMAGISLVLSACVPGPRVDGSPGITTTNEQVYVAYGPHVYAMNPQTGNVDWVYPQEANSRVSFYAPPLVTDDYLFVGDVANTFHKVNLETRLVVWTFTEATDFFMGQAAEENGIVYAPSNDGNLYAINPDGSLKWAFETGHNLWAQPVINNDVLFVGGMDHHVYAISLDGAELWATKMAGAVVESPVLSDDGAILYVGSVGREMAALRAADGTVIWDFSTVGGVWGRSLIANGTLYFGDSSGNLYALDPVTGEEQWRRNYPDAIVGGVSLLPDGLALISEGGELRVINFDGTPRWGASLNGNAFQAPIINGERLIVGIVDGDDLVYVFDLTGNRIWSDTPEK